MLAASQARRTKALDQRTTEACGGVCTLAELFPGQHTLRVHAHRASLRGAPSRCGIRPRSSTRQRPPGDQQEQDPTPMSEAGAPRGARFAPPHLRPRCAAAGTEGWSAANCRRTARVPRGEAPSRGARPRPIKRLAGTRPPPRASKANRVLAGTAVSGAAHSPAGLNGCTRRRASTGAPGADWAPPLLPVLLRRCHCARQDLRAVAAAEQHRDYHRVRFRRHLWQHYHLWRAQAPAAVKHAVLRRRHGSDAAICRPVAGCSTQRGVCHAWQLHRHLPQITFPARRRSVTSVGSGRST